VVSPEHSLIEIFLRDTVMYFALFSIPRFFADRQSEVVGGRSPGDHPNRGRRSGPWRTSTSQSLKAHFSFSRLSSGVLRWIDWAKPSASVRG
jgi:hypothetical protein